MTAAKPRPVDPIAQAACDAWNATHKIGDEVTYRMDGGKTMPAWTRTKALVLGGHTAVIWLDAISGCVALERVTGKDAS